MLRKADRRALCGIAYIVSIPESALYVNIQNNILLSLSIY